MCSCSSLQSSPSRNLAKHTAVFRVSAHLCCPLVGAFLLCGTISPAVALFHPCRLVQKLKIVKRRVVSLTFRCSAHCSEHVFNSVYCLYKYWSEDFSPILNLLRPQISTEQRALYTKRWNFKDSCQGYVVPILFGPWRKWKYKCQSLHSSS